jgi:hypothetical protein
MMTCSAYEKRRSGVAFLSRTGFLVFSAAGLILLLPTATVRGGGLIMSGLTMDLEASKGVTTDGSGNVLSWADQSGNGHDASQGLSGSQPTLVNNAVNGGPALLFNGNGSFLNIAGQVITSQQFTVLALVTDTSTGSGFREIFSNWTAANMVTSVFLGDTGQAPVRARFTDDMGGATDPMHTQSGVGTVSNPNTPFVLTGVSDTSDAFVYQNDTQIAAHGSALSARDLTTPYSIGTQGGFEFWSGYISAVVVYDRALSASEVQQDVAYLQGQSVPEPSSTIMGGMGFIFAVLVARARNRRA